VFAESIWLEPNRGDEIRLEAVLPNILDSEFTTFSMAWFLSGYVAVGDNLYLSADIPYAKFSSDRNNASSSSIGNPYLGLNVGRNDSGFMGEFGVRLPLASSKESAVWTGLAIEQVDRPEAFIRDFASIVLGANYRYRSQEGFGMRLRLAPILWFYTGDSNYNDGVEAWIAYSAQFLYISGPVSFGGGFTGRYLATSDGNGFGESSLNEFDVFLNLDYGLMKPSARLRIPLDEDLTDYLGPSLVLGLGFGYK
jgi:hypothetical protein